uniref:Uncharacterized protein n=1 Tax=Neogobius melanostomus TaxID=47308 RepID=A0A8C6TQI9_9GOBI
MECLSGVPVNANIYSALSKHHMAICVTSARRREEITNISHNQRQRDLAATTRKLRTAVWCALQMTLPKPVPRPEPAVSAEKPDETELINPRFSVILIIFLINFFYSIHLNIDFLVGRKTKCTA